MRCSAMHREGEDEEEEEEDGDEKRGSVAGLHS